MAVEESHARDAQTSYRQGRLAGLDGAEMLQRGLHGIVVHLIRAQLAATRPEDPAEDDPASMFLKAEAAASADRLLAFMAQLADTRTDLGERLVRCYTRLQRLVASGLASTGEVAEQAFALAVVEARALEYSFAVETLETSYD